MTDSSERSTQRSRADYFVAGRDAPPPPIEYIVDGLIPADGITVFVGAPRTGKSALMIGLAIAAAARTKWIGQSVKSAQPLILSYEAFNSTRRRLDAAVRGELDCPPIVVARPRYRLQANGAAEELREIIRTAAKDCESPIELIFVDSWQSATRGIDENSSKDVGAALGVLQALADELGVCIILIAHTGKDPDSREVRGSSFVIGDVEASLAIKRQNGGGIIEVDKLRDGEARAPIAYGLVQGADGIVKAIEADKATRSSPSQSKEMTARSDAGEDRPADEVFLACLTRHIDAGKRSSAAGGRNSAPALFAAEYKDAARIGRDRLAGALRRLLASGKVKVRMTGKESKPVQILDIVDVSNAGHRDDCAEEMARPETIDPNAGHRRPSNRKSKAMDADGPAIDPAIEGAIDRPSANSYARVRDKKVIIDAEMAFEVSAVPDASVHLNQAMAGNVGHRPDIGEPTLRNSDFDTARDGRATGLEPAGANPAEMLIDMMIAADGAMQRGAFESAARRMFQKNLQLGPTEAGGMRGRTLDALIEAGRIEIDGDQVRLHENNLEAFR